MSRAPRKPTFLQPSIWIKGLLLILCGWMLMVMVSVISLLATLQFLSLIITGEPQDILKELGYTIHRYTHELIAYLTFQKPTPPFPFS